MRKALILLTIVLFVLFCGTAFAIQKEVTLLWDHDKLNNDGSPADLVGFKIHYGSATASYTEIIDIAMATSCPDEPEEFCHKLIFDIPEGVITTYYFAATAYDSGANESGFSNEAVGTWDYEIPPAVVDLGGSYDDPSQTLTFSWTYDTAWLPKIEKWSLYESDSQGGPYTKVVDIPYDPSVSPPYTTDVVLPVPAGQKVTKYYIIKAHRTAKNNSAFSSDSNELTIVIDRMPPKAPFTLKVKIK
jgi:hypothetical protein